MYLYLYSFLPDEEEEKYSKGGSSPIDGKANERVFFKCFRGILGLSIKHRNITKQCLFPPLNVLRVMMFNISFHNSSVILWRSVLLGEETTDMSQVTDRLYHIMVYQVHIHLAMSEIQNHNFSFSIKLPSANSNTQLIADRN